MTLQFHIKGHRQQFHVHMQASLNAACTVIIGPSGCGKTSLLRAIAGLDQDLDCSLTWDDEDWSTVPCHHRGIAYVFQEPSLFPHLTVSQNIHYGMKRRGNQLPADKLNHIYDLLGISDLLPRNIHKLSGGEQQRIALARALASNPKLLLLDEPLASLDYERKQHIISLLIQLKRELHIPMLYVTHSLDEAAQLGDELLVLDRGHISHQGPCSTILSKLDGPFATQPDAESFISGVVKEKNADYHLTRVHCGDGDLWVYAPDHELDAVVRVRIAAKDVSICTIKPNQTSIMNILPCTITGIHQAHQAQATIQLQFGSEFFLARITKKSSVDLDLKEGMNVYAQIKSVAVHS